MSRLLTEEVSKVIDNAKMADIVDGRFSSKPYAEEVISETLKAVGEWLNEYIPKLLEAWTAEKMTPADEALMHEYPRTIEAIRRGEMPKEEK